MKNVLFVIPILLFALGCSSTANYSAMNLPMQLAAAPNRSANKIDLSSLAGPIQPADQLAVGDAVVLSIATGIETGKVPEWTLRVSEDGSLNVPLVGAVRVGGLKLTDAERMIAAESIQRGIYVSPNVTLTMEQRHSNRVTVMGAVNKPQTYELPAGASDMMTAISMAEGLSETASTIIQVRHPPGTGMRLAALSANRQVAYPSQAPPPPMPDQFDIEMDRVKEIPPEHRKLVDGSVLVVKEKPDRFINVIGLVNRPDSIEMPKTEDMRLLDAIAQAGGLALSVANEVRVIRRVNGQEVVIESSIQEAKQGGAANLVLSPGDVVSVEETPLTVAAGAAKTLFRFGFSAPIPGL